MIPWAVLRDDVIIELARAGAVGVFSDISEAVILRETLANQDFMKQLEGTLNNVAERVIAGRHGIAGTGETGKS